MVAYTVRTNSTVQSTEYRLKTLLQLQQCASLKSLWWRVGVSFQIKTLSCSDHFVISVLRLSFWFLTAGVSDTKTTTSGSVHPMEHLPGSVWQNQYQVRYKNCAFRCQLLETGISRLVESKKCQQTEALLSYITKAKTTTEYASSSSLLVPWVKVPWLLLSLLYM